MNIVAVKRLVSVGQAFQRQIQRWPRQSASLVVIRPQRQCCTTAAATNSSSQQTTTRSAKKSTNLAKGPGLKEFLVAGKNLPVKRSGSNLDGVPYFDSIDINGHGRKVFFEVYGCQMNVNDTEIVWSILKSNNYVKADLAEEADVILLITCAIRENAESKVRHISFN